MSLGNRPTPPDFPAIGEGFTVTAAVPAQNQTAYLIAIELASGDRRELVVGDYLAEQLATVEPDELPIILALREPANGQPWRFDYLGRPDPAHLRAVGPPDRPVNEAENLADLEPYRFDPAPHMDLATAEPPSELPPPAPPGPAPPPDAQTAPPNPVPPPARPLGSYGDQSVPFAH